MLTKRLGNTSLELTRIGLGTWAIGGGNWKFGWGPQDDEESIRTIHRALDVGINWIDTAPAYGLGHCEEVVGRALRGLKQRPIVATKCGRCWDEQRQLFPRLKRASVMAEVEASLRRLGVDVIDLYQMHWPQPDEDIEEAWGVVADLVRAGKIRYGGVSNFSVAQLKRIQQLHPIASLQPPYSMLARGVEAELLPFCGANQIGVVAYSPMQKGLLTGKITHEWIEQLAAEDHRRNDVQFHEPKLSANLALVEGLRQIAARHGHTVAHVALAWVLRRGEVTAAIVGARRPAQIEETAAAGDWQLSGDDLSEIDGLLGVHGTALAAAG
ncbi:MAG: aldo/keto reductase [Planctomycetes bacterium]|nr:aldo/keto reductase [Planctomycetota bacterium]